MTYDPWSRGPAPNSVPVRVVALLGAAALLVVLLRCGGPDVLDPDPPRTSRDDPLAAPERPLSVINVPMGIPLRRLTDLVEQAVPLRHGDLDDLRERPDSGRVIAAYELERSPFRASFVDDVARLSALVSYRLRMRYSLPALPDIGGSCGLGDSPRPQLYVALESPMSIDADWSLRTRVRVAELHPASTRDEDRCEVTVFGIDVTDDVVEGARSYLEEHLSDIDALVADVDTRSRFESWWSTLREPVALDDSVWLAMRPEAIQRGPLRGSGDSVTVELALRSRPEIVIGARPAVVATPLPALDSGTVVPRLALVVDARAEYSTASRLLTELLGGRSIDMNGRTVRVDSVRVYGIGSGQLAMEVSVSGDLGGHLYLTGRPAINRRTGRVSVPDLEMDVATRDIVLSTANWFAARSFREQLRDRATWPTTSAVEWLAEWLDRGLNRDISDDLSVAGVVDTVEIIGVTALTDALRVRMSARGSASMYVRN